MKTIKIQHIAIILSTLFFFTSCKKDPENEPNNNELKTSSFEIKTEHTWGPSGSTVPFELNKWITHPKTGDSLKFDQFKFYLTNVQLKKSDGTWWVDDESYYLVDLSMLDGNTVTIDNVPNGTYTELKYILGVDSARNNSGAQIGALSTMNGMFWSWNTGYIFLKAEGESPQSPDQSFAFHLGGFQGVNNIISNKTTGFNGEPLEIATNSKPVIHINSRPSMLWHNAKSVSEINRIMMPSASAKAMADEYFGSFVFDHIHR